MRLTFYIHLTWKCYWPLQRLYSSWSGCHILSAFTWMYTLGCNHFRGCICCIYFGIFTWVLFLGCLHSDPFTWVHSLELILLDAHSLGCIHSEAFICVHTLVSIPSGKITLVNSLWCIHLGAFTWMHSLGCIYWIKNQLVTDGLLLVCTLSLQIMYPRILLDSMDPYKIG